MKDDDVSDVTSRIWWNGRLGHNGAILNPASYSELKRKFDNVGSIWNFRYELLFYSLMYMIVFPFTIALGGGHIISNAIPAIGICFFSWVPLIIATMDLTMQHKRKYSKWFRIVFVLVSAYVYSFVTQSV